jgi:CBS domain-containing protein
VIKCFDEHVADFFCVIDHDGRLCGLVTRTDLFRAVDAGARVNTPIFDVMMSTPIVVTMTDSAMMAAETMRDHGFKWLPVVDNHETYILQGFVRAERMLSAIIPHLQAQPTP